MRKIFNLAQLNYSSYLATYIVVRNHTLIMKNIIALILVLFCVTAQAQVFTITSDVANKTAAQAKKDTVTNTATKTQSIRVNKGYPSAVIYTKVTKISGTTAGYVRLFVSDDGVNYIRLGGADSAAVANVSTVQNLRFAVPGTPDRFYRISYTGVGTMSASLASTLIAKP